MTLSISMPVFLFKEGGVISLLPTSEGGNESQEGRWIWSAFPTKVLRKVGIVVFRQLIAF